MSRCPNCGVSLDPSALSCSACGARMAPSSAGAVSDRGYHIAPLPIGNYDAIRLGASETLNAAFRMWSRDWGRLVVLALIPMVFTIPMLIGVGVLAFFSTKDAGDGMAASEIALIGVAIVGAIIMMIGYSASMAGMIASVDERERTGGNELTIWEAFLHGLSKAGRFLVGGVVPYFLFAFGAVAALMPVTMTFFDDNSDVAILIIPGMLFFVFSVWAYTRLAPAMVVAVVEDVSVSGLFSRSFQLTRGKSGTVFVSGLLFSAVIFGAAIAAGILSLIPLVGFLVNIAFNLITMSLGPIWFHALYAGLVNESKR